MVTSERVCYGFVCVNIIVPFVERYFYIRTIPKIVQRMTMNLQIIVNDEFLINYSLI